MADWGVFAVSRGVWDHPVLDFGKEPFTRREAWMWLVSATAYKPICVGRAGRVVPIERGEFCFSIRFLERKWRWKPGRVERFLKVLKTHDMIRDKSRDRTTVYSISNYNDYQVVGLPKRDTERDTDHDTTATASRQDRDKEEEIKKVKKDKTRLSSVPAEGAKSKKTFLNGHQKDFDEFYAAYPKHQAKGDAMKAYAAALKLAEPAVLLEAARHYRRNREGEDGQFTPLPASWLRKLRWLDEAPISESALDPELEAARKLNDEFIKSKGYT